MLTFILSIFLTLFFSFEKNELPFLSYFFLFEASAGKKNFFFVSSDIYKNI